MATATAEPAPAADAETTSPPAGHVMTPREELVQELVKDLQDQYDAVAAAEKELVAPRAKVAKLEKTLKEEKEELKSIVEALAHARAGNPIQKRMFGKDKKAADAANKVAAKVTDADPGKTAKISVLGEHGITEKKLEILEQHEITTIAELETRMRTDPLWHKKIKGFGGKMIDTLSDALLAWRQKNPVPDPADAPAEKAGGETPNPSEPTAEGSEPVAQPDYSIGMDDKLKSIAVVGIRLWTLGSRWVAGAVCTAFPGGQSETQILVEDLVNLSPCPGRNEAIVACCKRMEKAWADLKTTHGRKVAKRIAETRKFIENEIKEAAEAATEASTNVPATPDSSASATAEEPEGIEPVAIPTTEGGIRLGLRIHKSDNGVWSSGFTVDDDEKSVHMKSPVPGGPTFGNEKDALRFSCQALIRWLPQDANSPRYAEAAKAATDFLALIGTEEPAAT